MRAINLYLLLVCWLSNFSVSAEPQSNNFKINDQLFTVTANNNEFSTTFTDVKNNDGVYHATINLTSNGEPAIPPRFTIQWQTPSVDIAGVWNPIFNEDHIVPADWSSKKLDSMLTRNAPVYTLFGHDDVNRYTVAVSDAVNLVNLSARVREEDSMIYHQIELLSEKHREVSSYQVKLRIDTRNIPFYTALKGVSDWWAQMPEYKPIEVPDVATEPMYSTWYSYHQNVEHKALLSEAKLSKALGYEAIIVDDGWQTNDSSRGYAYTGDWKPERLVEIKKFVDDVHALGMKALLWYSIPFVGEKAEVAERFKGKYLSHSTSLQAYVLDPRYPEVREYLIGHYVNAVQEWGWDGLKLDFIDQFRADENTQLDTSNGRDYASVYEAVDRLMSDLITELKAVNPDVMVEFRQRYIGPAMRKYGNMFRATDIPNGAVTNRRRIVDLRLLSGDTAVHSDMLMWHYEEPVEVAALQLLNIIHSVPQLSVRLADLPQEHVNMVRNYTRYWKDNKEILLSEEFKPRGIFANYPVIESKKGSKKIISLYNDSVVYVGGDDIKAVDILNAKKSHAVIIKFDNDWNGINVVIKDSQGNLISKNEIALNSSLLEIDVPSAGLLSISKI